MPEIFEHNTLRVRFHDVDHAGIIFFAKIYEYCHVVYEDFIEDAVGLDPNSFFELKDFGAPLVATRSSHHHVLRHGDHMRFACRVTHIGRSSMTVHYDLYNQHNTLCARVATKHAFIQRSGLTSIPIPDDVRTQLQRFFDPEYQHALQP